MTTAISPASFRTVVSPKGFLSAEAERSTFGSPRRSIALPIARAAAPGRCRRSHSGNQARVEGARYGHDVIEHGRSADLIIAGQTDPDWESSPLQDTAEHLALGSGRPVLVVPYVGAGPDSGDRRGRFFKFGTRPALDISTISIGLGAVAAGNRLRDVRIALGAAAPTPVRAPD